MGILVSLKKIFLMSKRNFIAVKLFEMQRSIPIVNFGKNFVEHVFTNRTLEKKEFTTFNLLFNFNEK